ncbi:unnamed protein product [Mytilus coruscus]|uniref:RNase H type-1 domain-containing protein n=1 Tax=Mytilus coruscus TaxID=42192 RepID=A0A6J8DBG7_MYTCO|nr:unnamed protein product [Mytilus coruscus]
MPLQLRRDHLSLKYCARTKRNPTNPANQLVDDCIEYQIYNHKWNDHNIPYGFRVQNLIKDNDLAKIKLVTKNIQDPPPWIVGQAISFGQKNIEVTIEWIPAHVGILGNEKVGKLAKLALSNDKIDLNKTSLRRPTTLQKLSGSVTQKWSQAITGSTAGSSRRLQKTSLRRPTTLQELSGLVTQKWSLAVTGNTTGSPRRLKTEVAYHEFI